MSSIDKFPQMPCLHTWASAESRSKQNAYAWILRANLTVLVIVPLALALWHSSRTVELVAGSLLAIASVLSLLIRTGQHQSVWFGARSVAESTKTLAWKYMMRAAPYGGPAQSEAVDSLFISDLRAIMDPNASIAIPSINAKSEITQISKQMREIRSLPWRKRSDIYSHYRLDEESAWYTNKSAQNARNARLLFDVLIVLQMGAAVLAFLRVSLPQNLVSLTAVCSAFTSALLAWCGFRNYDTLAKSYGVAASELTMLLTMSIHNNAEEQFAQFVSDAENAISREHKLWHAKRNGSQPAQSLDIAGNRQD